MKTDYTVCSSIGTVRKENQDNFYLNGLTKPVKDNNMMLQKSSQEQVQFFVVCDGMGGEDAGEIAASIAVETFQSMKGDLSLERCLHYIKKANAKICQYQNKHDLMTGTTFAGLLIDHGEAYAINVGDSRIYQIHREKICQLSTDHTEYQMMVEAGIMMNERTKRTSKNRLTQFLGIPGQEIELEPSIRALGKLREGDYFLLCSDGLYGAVEEELLLELICDEQYKLDEVAKKLVETAEKQGSRDNITAMLIHILAVDQKETVPDQEVEDTEQTVIIERRRTESESNEADKLIGKQESKKITVQKKDEDKDNISEQIVFQHVEENVKEQREAHVQDKKRRKKRIIGNVVLSIILILAAGIGYWMWNHPVVPNVANMEATAGQDLLEKTGFRVLELAEYSTEIAEKHIIMQSPEDVKRMRRGSAVTICISLGAEPVEVPDVVKMSQKNGSKILKENGFKVDITLEYHKKIKEGTILNQTPSAGGMLIPGETIKLTVSTRQRVKKGSN